MRKIVHNRIFFYNSFFWIQIFFSSSYVMDGNGNGNRNNIECIYYLT